MRILLWGKALLAGACLMIGVAAWCQEQAPAKHQVSSLDVAVSYDALRNNATTGRNFWMQGGRVQAHGQFWRGLGVVADVAGMHSGNIQGSGVGLDLVTVTFGPRYSWTRAHTRFTVFGHAQGGLALGFNSTFPGPSIASEDATSLATRLGGGMNYSLSPRIALRVIQADWLRTQMPNATTNVQNNLNLGAGFVYRFR